MRAMAGPSVGDPPTKYTSRGVTTTESIGSSVSDTGSSLRGSSESRPSFHVPLSAHVTTRRDADWKPYVAVPNTHCGLPKSFGIAWTASTTLPFCR